MRSSVWIAVSGSAGLHIHFPWRHRNLGLWIFQTLQLTSLFWLLLFCTCFSAISVRSLIQHLWFCLQHASGFWFLLFVQLHAECEGCLWDPCSALSVWRWGWWRWCSSTPCDSSATWTHQICEQKFFFQPALLQSQSGFACGSVPLHGMVLSPSWEQEGGSGSHSFWQSTLVLSPAESWGARLMINH